MRWAWAALLMVGCSHRALSLFPVEPEPDLGGEHGVDLSAPASDLSIPPDLATQDLATPVAGSSDGVCMPGSVGSGRYDPDCVYLLGTLQEGSSGLDALVYPGLPDDFAVGFVGDPFSAVIRPSDGRMVFIDEGVGYVFHPDMIAPGAIFPTQPSANDDELSTPACASGVDGVYVFPDDSQVAYVCYELTYHFYLEGQATELYRFFEKPIALGPGRTVLAQEAETAAAAVVIFGPGGTVPVQNIWPGGGWEVIAARAINDGFLVAAIVNDTPLTANLMKVQLDGTTTTLGAYQRGGYSGFGRCWMEPGGALECAMALLTLEDAIVRFTLSAPPELLYDELGKKVKLHGSSLVTGP